MPRPGPRDRQLKASASSSRCWRRGGGAAPCCAFAGRTSSACRYATSRNCRRFRISNTRQGICAGSAAIGLDRRQQHSDRYPLGRGWVGTNRRYAEELVALAPDVIMAAGNSSAGPMLQATRTIPVVFTIVPDAVGAGVVDSPAQPGRNDTGFTSFAYDIGGKWLELLKEIAPHVTRVAVLRDPPPPLGLVNGARFKRQRHHSG